MTRRRCPHCPLPPSPSPEEIALWISHLEGADNALLRVTTGNLSHNIPNVLQTIRWVIALMEKFQA
jgi:hypothetical protein